MFLTEQEDVARSRGKNPAKRSQIQSDESEIQAQEMELTERIIGKHESIEKRINGSRKGKERFLFEKFKRKINKKKSYGNFRFQNVIREHCI